MEDLLWSKRKPDHTVKIKDNDTYSKSQLEGIRFEEAFCEHLKALHGKAIIGPWIEYMDANGWGLCQPDALTVDPFIIYECKLSYTPKAYTEISRLYRPVCERWLNLKRPKMVTVCKYLKPIAKSIELTFTLEEVHECKKKKMILLWN